MNPTIRQKPLIHQVADEFATGFSAILVKAAGGPLLEHIPKPLRNDVPSAETIRTDIRQMTDVVARKVLGHALTSEVYATYERHNPRRFYIERTEGLVNLERRRADYDMAIMGLLQDYAVSIDRGVVFVDPSAHTKIILEADAAFAAEHAFVGSDSYAIKAKHRLLKPLYHIAWPHIRKSELTAIAELNNYFRDRVQPAKS